MQRYNFESNSQHGDDFPTKPEVVANNAKIQFWKQFTTLANDDNLFELLLLIMQRYNFESNSQHGVIYKISGDSCC